MASHVFAAIAAKKGPNVNALVSKSILGICTAALIGATMLPLAASAGEVNNRIDRQQARIDRGVADGQMTRGEFDRTESRLARIDAQRERDLRANDGHLTPGERARLNRELNRNSRAIFFDNHNRARQPGAPLR
jgi:hypothetical protein